jgi:hypothetical protein
MTTTSTPHAPAGPAMKAFALDALGTPPALRDDLAAPTPGAREVLVRVRASHQPTTHDGAWAELIAVPWTTRSRASPPAWISRPPAPAGERPGRANVMALPTSFARPIKSEWV